jgi:ADP-ribose pyrophosphatase
VPGRDQSALSKKDLTEHFVSGETVYDGILLEVHHDRVRLPDGSESAREYIRHPGAVAIVALFEDGKLLLERQFRYPHRRVFIEVPAGKVDPGEAHLATAQRELLEETGYAAAEWSRVGVIHPSIAYTDETIEIYVARGLTLKTQKLDQGEFLETFSVPFEEAIGMIRDGRITDAKTVSALFLVENLGR